MKDNLSWKRGGLLKFKSDIEMSYWGQMKRKKKKKNTIVFGLFVWIWIVTSTEKE